MQSRRTQNRRGANMSGTIPGELQKNAKEIRPIEVMEKRIADGFSAIQQSMARLESSIQPILLSECPQPATSECAGQDSTSQLGYMINDIVLRLHLTAQAIDSIAERSSV